VKILAINHRHADRSINLSESWRETERKIRREATGREVKNRNHRTKFLSEGKVLNHSSHHVLTIGGRYVEFGKEPTRRGKRGGEYSR